MALSSEEKQAREVATSERDRAWISRHRARRCLEKKGEREIEKKYRPLFDASYERRKSRENAIQAARVIRDDAIKAAHEAFEQAVAAARVTYELDDRPFAECRADEKALQQRLNEEFPDLVGAASWSAAAWKPLS